MEEGHSTETGKVEIARQISSQEEPDALTGNESIRNYKLYSNGTCGMNPGYQYAVAVKIKEEGNGR